VRPISSWRSSRRVLHAAISARSSAYAETEVLEYWIVDPGLGTFEFLERTGDAFRVRLPEAGIYRSDVIAGLELDVDTFWRLVSA
jgi:hypothetical protein